MDKPRTEQLLELIAQELHRAHIIKTVEAMIDNKDATNAKLEAEHAASLLEDIGRRRIALGFFRTS